MQTILVMTFIGILMGSFFGPAGLFIGGIVGWIIGFLVNAGIYPLG